ncbi:hypothetical protein Kim5_CH02380 [Rhizobium sp. Kim5]|nr:hypothetical protein Kim5_CH02380 [Rhizobium sp. Kim5]
MMSGNRPFRIANRDLLRKVKFEPTVLGWQPFQSARSAPHRLPAPPGSSHWTRPVLRTPARGAKGMCRGLSVPIYLTQGTSPLPVKRGEG